MDPSSQFSEPPGNPGRFTLSVLCTHIEVFALVAPLLWVRHGTALRNLARLGAALVAMLLMAVLRVDIAVLLSHHGLPWALAHDVLLGVCYAVIIVATLHLGGWMRSANDRQAATRS